MAKVHLLVDGAQVEADAGSTLLAALDTAGIYVPHLCASGENARACRLCFVEVMGSDVPQCACELAVKEGMTVSTGGEGAARLARRAFSLLASQHAIDCGSCPKADDCEIKRAGRALGLNVGAAGKAAPAPDADGVSIRCDKCILCGRCVTTCAECGGAILGYIGRGSNTAVEPVRMDAAQAAACRECAVCLQVCPAGAVTLA